VKTPEIAVIGGGPAGLSCALSFVAAGGDPRAIVVYERARYPREKPCAGGLGGRGEAILFALGAMPDVPAVPVSAASLQGRFGFRRVEPARDLPGGTIGRVIRREAFDGALAECARSRGIRIEEGYALQALEERAEHIHATFTDRGGVEKSLQFPIVVGADGVGSTVRKSLGLGRGLPYAQVVECDTETTPYDRPRDELHFDVEDRRYHGYAWDFPTLVAGSPAVCRGVYVVRWGGCDEAGVCDPGALLEERLVRLGARPLSKKRKRFAERGWLPGTTISSRRRLLIGEAAGIDPVTGEGIAQALESGFDAGKFLAARHSPARWSMHFARSRLGRDLRLRTGGLAPFFGRSRDAVEALLLADPTLLDAATRHFAGLPLERAATAVALLRGAAAAAEYKLRRR
jgi:flavin-dependent dehydrogenase